MFPSFLLCYNLNKHNIFIKVKKFSLTHAIIYRLKTTDFIQISPLASLKLSFLFQDAILYTMSNVFVMSPPACGEWPFLILFHDLDMFEKYWQVICRMSLNFCLSNVSSWLDWGYEFGEKYWKGDMPCPSCSILSRETEINMSYWCDVNLDY